jgi:hypothetical protein
MRLYVCVCECLWVKEAEEKVLETSRTLGGTEVISDRERMKIE